MSEKILKIHKPKLIFFFFERKQTNPWFYIVLLRQQRMNRRDKGKAFRKKTLTAECDIINLTEIDYVGKNGIRVSRNQRDLVKAFMKWCMVLGDQRTILKSKQNIKQRTIDIHSLHHKSGES